jgi:hypothetical protein
VQSAVFVDVQLAPVTSSMQKTPVQHSTSAEHGCASPTQAGASQKQPVLDEAQSTRFSNASSV